ERGREEGVSNGRGYESKGYGRRRGNRHLQARSEGVDAGTAVPADGVRLDHLGQTRGEMGGDVPPGVDREAANEEIGRRGREGRKGQAVPRPAFPAHPAHPALPTPPTFHTCPPCPT